MATDELSFVADGARVEVTGLRAALRDMERMGVEAEELRELMSSIAELVADAANPPRKSGSLAGTIRPGRVKTRAVIRAGRASVPYAGPIHYGWAARNITPRPFLTDALASRQAAILAELDAGLQRLIEGT